ncbi:PREDICTED: uncharacterized protein LOC104728692 [Camelina sativa]|uniref:Uncharacterized protein LOC104728692 n=1 Tax=Camelina sativa TaxID=90675 RepID=A0ABM0UT75_CAMSA|nr:PREDICTED: uncharacterized protein LOC104728692 [Camelina sativa]
MVPTDRLEFTSGTPLPDGSKYRQIVGSTSPGQTLRFLSTSYLSLCIVLLIFIDWQSREFFAILLGLKTVVSFFVATIPLLFMPSQMLIGETTRMITLRHGHISFILVVIMLLGLLRSKNLFLALLERQEYWAVADATSELCWVVSFLRELGIKFVTQPIIYCDNVGASYLVANPMFHSGMKHVALDYHFVRELVQYGFFESLMCLPGISWQMH